MDSIEHPDAPHSPLDRPATRASLRALFEQGLISAPARDAAIGRLEPHHHWWRWANRGLLFLGATLVLAGIIFFFAYNWRRMSAPAKFGAVEVALWASAIGAWRRGLDDIAGKVLMLSACVFVGVLLAVYGQVYQTGADAWPIYAWWTLLILPWVVITRFAALWALWLVVLNAAIILAWQQEELLVQWRAEGLLFSLLGIVDAAGLIFWEVAAKQDRRPTEAAWLRWLLWFATLTIITIPAILLIAEGVDDDLGYPVGGGLWLLIATGGYFYFRARSPAILGLAAVITSLTTVVLTAIGRVLLELSDDAGSFLLFGIIILLVTTAAALWLRYEAKQLRHAS